jgi:hypothetical protein
LKRTCSVGKVERSGWVPVAAVVAEQYCQTTPFVTSWPRVDGVLPFAALPQVVVPPRTSTPSETGVPSARVKDVGAMRKVVSPFDKT